MQSNWMETLANPQSQLVKKFIFDLLQERYGRNVDIIERISRQLITKGDLENFIKFAIVLFEAGYLKAVSDHKDVMTKMGIPVTVKAQEPPKKVEKIFKDQPT